MSFLSRLAKSIQAHNTPLPAMIVPEGAQRATLAAGCFWGVEHVFRKNFGNRGLLDARVGYIGGDVNHPSYRAVCSGRTGHAEAVELVFDPKQVSYRTLIEFFYKMHDPTTANAQGPDVGSQYRSAIFFHNREQEQVARDITDKVNRQWWQGKVKTEVVPAGEWFDAEKYHQMYLENNPMGYECPSHFLRRFPPLEEAPVEAQL
ncbi:peptide methionine sulfoxide reductase msrB/msrA [Sporormia fimetaria CBS 119925]|uniref:peptide-methionine (S)-S-oxide reductase n=1 Tax=Sporormia fimetaria CBS 119925 TaxID=1340428 RepID=A0A6A6VHB3_9PLEO|nr:peptide methionine sulfoxide reductase msrB/msrA [Sporormia fimetaria CBS 119925]